MKGTQPKLETPAERARISKNINPLRSPTSREKLTANPNGHARTLTDGLALLYYPSKVKGRAGTWMARRYLGEKKYDRRNLGAADDVPGSVADGAKVLDFAQAAEAAQAWHKDAANAAQKADKAGAATVGAAVRDYVEWRLERSPKAGKDAKRRLGHHVLKAPLAAVALADLRMSDLEAWRAALRPGRHGRAPKGEESADKPATMALATPTLARLFNDLRAALNAAARKLRIGGDFDAVVREGLRAPEGAQTARGMQVLADAQVARIVAVAQARDADFGALVLVLATTGCRFDQAARMTVGDLQPGEMRILVPTSQKGRGIKKARQIALPLSPRDIDALEPAALGKMENEPLLMRWFHQRVGGVPPKWERAGRKAWAFSAEMSRDWRAVCKEIGLPDTIVPYALRHSSIVRMLKNRVPTRLVAAAHDTSVAMIELTYGRYIVDASEELLRKVAVTMTPPPPSGGDNVVPMRQGAA